MNIEQARKNLERFLGDKVLTFSIRHYPDGEWVAECNEISAIMTGGMGNDIANMDRMIREAILTAAGINTDYAEEVLKFVGYEPKLSSQKVSSWFRPSQLHSPISIEKEAEYVITA